MMSLNVDTDDSNNSATVYIQCIITINFNDA